jgi:hypothetical protein
MTTVPVRLQPPNPPAPFVGRAALTERIEAAIARAPVTVLWGYSGAGKSAVLAHVLAKRFAAERSHTLVIDTRDVSGSEPVAAALERLRVLDVVFELADDDDAPSVLVETLESRGLWLIVENIERIVVESPLARALALLQRFARRAKIVVVCREDPRVAMLAGQTIAIGLMADDDLCELIGAVRPELDASDATEIVAHARGSPWRLLQLSTGGTDPSAGPEASLLALSPVAQNVLRTLALVTHAIPRGALQSSTRGADDATLDLLSRRGYLEFQTRNVRLHDAARALVTADLAPDERTLRQGRLLRALLALNDPDEAAAGARAALALVAATREALALDELLARFGFALRNDGASQALLDVLLSMPHAPLGMRDAWECLLTLDVGATAVARARPATTRSAHDEAWFSLVERARSGAELDASEALEMPMLTHALAAVRDARRALDERRPREARAALTGQHTTTATFEGRLVALALARASLLEGALDDARAKLELLASLTDSAVRDGARMSLLALRLAEGFLSDFAADAADLSLALDENGASVRMTEELDHLRSAFASLVANDAQSPRRAFFAPLILDDTVRALVEGDAPGAQRDALKLRGSAREEGCVFAALEAGVVALDAVLVSGDIERATSLAKTLAKEAELAGSRRFALEARFALACTKDVIAPADLVDLSARVHANPVVARRASSLLGEVQALDALDRLVVAACAPRAPAGGRVIHSTGAAEWTLDVEAMHILLHGGHAVDLSSKRVLFDLLLALSRRGGEATKEQLLEDAWGVRDYHPLRHDNRLKAAVRKLRRLFESTLGDDPLETTDDGYRLRGHVRVVGDRVT